MFGRTYLKPAALDVERIPRLGMVGWYNPGQLLRTGLRVIVSTLFGRHSDSRLHDAVASQPPLLEYDVPKYLDDDQSFGFDYVADTGDGWNSTYAVAYSLSQAALTPSNHEQPLIRGKLLVLGGDLVYPDPTRERYEGRLVGPFAVAGQLIPKGATAEVVAIPGNHDWYDSLVSFRKLFCCQENIASRTTRQTRSYFAARLPFRWWLFGLDMQLDGDLDEPQLRFFQRVVGTLTDDDRVILCLPEPAWQKRWDPRRNDGILVPSLVEVLVQALGDKVWVCLAGDLHHYQRHSSTSPGPKRHLVTCGTGGAFLHPTHTTPCDGTGEFTHEKSFPDKEQSRKLAYWNLRFVTRNPAFGIVPAIAYLLAAWQNGLAVGECFANVCIEEMGRLGLGQWKEAAYAGFHSALLSPIGITLYGLIFWAFVFFADNRSRRFRYTVGTLHALSHVGAGFLVYWFGVYVAITIVGLAPKAVAQYLVTGTIIFVLGWIVGSVILGIYLLVSLNNFGRHFNEAFSSLRIQDWKGFLRCRITQDGSLTMRFIGFKRVPRRWKAAPLGGGGSILVPVGGAGAFVGEVVDTIEISGLRRSAAAAAGGDAATP